MFSHSYFSSQYFPPVWFSPADELHLVEDEIRPEYRGGTGRMLPARKQFSDASDDDIRRLVDEKWEVIKQAGKRDRARQDNAGDDSCIVARQSRNAEVTPEVQDVIDIEVSTVLADTEDRADFDTGLTIVQSSNAAIEQERRNQEAIAILLLEAS